MVPAKAGHLEIKMVTAERILIFQMPLVPYMPTLESETDPLF